MHLPAKIDEMNERGWVSCDVIIITGDAYVDHPSFGAALIGRYLESHSYKVGIISQPDWKSDEDFLKLGIPKLFAAVTAGNIDSMLAHYTANKKIRSDDAYTPGDKHGKRPDRATIVYTNKVKQLMPGIPIVIGGIEASMRRLAHYDFWSDSLRRSILLDAKADILVYGMGETAIKEIAERIACNQPIENIRGTAISKGAKSFHPEHHNEALWLPSFTELKKDKTALIKMTQTLENNQNPYNARTLIQEFDGQYVIVNPPALPLETEELDSIYELTFTRKPHPSYNKPIPAFDMIKDSVTILRGCPGGCTFCSLGQHQGKLIQSRSIQSILNELNQLAGKVEFKGTISDLGGPSANVYYMGCKDIKAMNACIRPSCLYPSVCNNFNTSSKQLIELMQKARKVYGIKRVHITSGIRYDLALYDLGYISELVRYHTSGHLKIAPEHFEDSVLKLMRKPSQANFDKFLEAFNRLNKISKKKQYLLPYLISGFPGCTRTDMQKVADYLKKNKIKVEQVQEFIPLPMTVSAAMYYTELDYFTGNKIYVAKNKKERETQKDLLFWWKKDFKKR